VESENVKSGADLRLKETIRIIMGRRSVRKFEPRQVEPEKTRIILECGFAAPSAKNIRPCHLVLIDDPALLKKIGESTTEARMVTGAPLAIAVCVDAARYERESSADGTWIEDASCAMMNMLLAARTLGLEGVWLQILNRPARDVAISPLLSLPEGVKILAISVLGYPDAEKPPYSGVDEERLHTNGW
jgi:nitroreductase